MQVGEHQVPRSMSDFSEFPPWSSLFQPTNSQSHVQTPGTAHAETFENCVVSTRLVLAFPSADLRFHFLRSDPSSTAPSTFQLPKLRCCFLSSYGFTSFKKNNKKRKTFTVCKWDLGREQNQVHVFSLPSYPRGLVLIFLNDKLTIFKFFFYLENFIYFFPPLKIGIFFRYKRILVYLFEKDHCLSCSGKLPSPVLRTVITVYYIYDSRDHL